MRSRPNPLGWWTKNNGQDMWWHDTSAPEKSSSTLMQSHAHLFIKMWHRVLRTQPLVTDVKKFLCRTLAFVCVCVCLVVYGSFSLWINGGGSNQKFARHFTRKLSCTSVEQAFYLFTWTEQLVCLLWELAIRVLVLVSLLQYLSQQCIAQGLFFHALRDDLRV